MKNKIILIVILGFILVGCGTPSYLPEYKNVGISNYGSYIKLYTKNDASIDGELIAIDSSRIAIFSDEYKKCLFIPIKELNGFKLRYASPQYLSWSIPIFSLATISHGLGLIFSFPFNLAITIPVTVGGQTAFQYDESKISLNDLKMFARFPHGFPPNVSPNQIKSMENQQEF